MGANIGIVVVVALRLLMDYVVIVTRRYTNEETI